MRAKLISPRGPLMDQLAALRRERGVRQAELAADLGVAQATISQWENGYRAATEADLVKLASVYGCRWVLVADDQPVVTAAVAQARAALLSALAAVDEVMGGGEPR